MIVFLLLVSLETTKGYSTVNTTTCMNNTDGHCHDNCKVYTAPNNICYNPKRLFHNDSQWGDYDIIDKCELLGKVIKRCFYTSKNDSCVDESDCYTLQADICVGPFGKPRPWGTLTCQ
eukprot:m.181673 g.181673  ORF g.181673 m.181673 type:complete len:118 (-) comp15515_c0_seq15:119-472(-)